MIWQMKATMLSFTVFVGTIISLSFVDCPTTLCHCLAIPPAFVTATFGILSMCQYFDAGIVLPWDKRNANLAKFVSDKSLESGISEKNILESSSELLEYRQLCEERASQLNVSVEDILKMDRDKL